MTRPPAPVARFRVRALAVLLVWAILELACWAFFTLARDRVLLPESNPARYTVDPGKIKDLARYFEPTLGWVPPRRGADEARPRTASLGRPALAAFGDSYTYCSEVEDAETWEQYLGQALGRDVENYGVGGYGPDQSLLRYRQLRRRIASRRVALGFIYENINRLVNRYRPFYQARTGLPLPKPMFVLSGANLELRPNPIRSAAELARLTDPKFIARLAEDDFWYRRPALPRLGFPYSRLPLSPALWKYVLNGRDRGEGQAPAQVDLWSSPDATALFFAVVEAFVGEVTGDGRRAVLLVLPTPQDVATLQAARAPAGQSAVRSFCEERRLACFDGVAALASSGLPESERYRRGGHLTASANRVLGESLRLFLERLAPEEI